MPWSALVSRLLGLRYGLELVIGSGTGVCLGLLLGLSIRTYFAWENKGDQFLWKCILIQVSSHDITK